MKDQKRFLFLVVSYHTVNFFRPIINKLLEKGHKVRILAIHDLPAGAREDGFDSHKANWHRFEWDYLEGFEPHRVIIFNGFFRLIHAASRILQMKYDTYFAEVAWFTQNDYIYIDRDIHQRSCLAKRIDLHIPTLVGPVKKKHLNKLREKYLPKPLSLNLPKNYVLLPLQLERDTSILYASNIFKDMNSLVGYVKKGLGNDIPLVVKCHPKSHTDELESKADLSGADVIINDKDVSMNDLVLNSTMVVGINSTSLMEALIHYKPVLQFGDNIAYSNGHYGSIGKDFDFTQPEQLRELYASVLNQEWSPNVPGIDGILLTMLANQIDFRNPEPWIVDALIEGIVPVRLPESLT